MNNQRQPLFGLLTALAGLSFSFLGINLVFGAVQPDGWRFLLFCLLLGLLGLANSLLHYLLVRSAPAGELATRSVRQFGVLLIAAWLAFSLINITDGLACLRPGVFNIVGLIGLGLSAAVDFSLRKLLFSRQDLYGLIAENSEDTLMERFGRQRELVFDAFQGMQALRRGSLTLLVLGIAVVMATSWMGPISLGETLAFLVFLSTCCSLMSLANGYAEEHRVFLFGITIPFRFQRIRQLWAYALIPVCLLPALLLAGDSSIINPLNLAAWLSALISALPHATPPDRAEIQRIAAMMLPPSQAPSAMSLDPKMDFLINLLPILFTIVRWLGLAAILTGIVWFLTKPLMEKGFSARRSLAWFLRRLIHFLREPWLKLLRFLRALIRYITVHLQPLGPAAARPATVRDYLKRLLATGDETNAPASGHRHRRKSVEWYGEFLVWAVGRGLVLNLADTPGEIAEKIIALVPGEGQAIPSAAEIRLVTELLEKDLFAKEGWRGNDGQRMQEAVRALVNPPAQS